ncbi:MAG: substrate-binding domain-containing protein, partial [Verrucomicrobiales bacterium]
MKPFFKAALALCVALAMSGVASAAGKPLTIAVIPKGTSHEFWKSINAGAVKAKQELEAQGQKINLIWKGPLREDDREQQIQVVENFVARRIDGIVLAPLDSKALTAPVSTATRARIPVVIIDSALDSRDQVSYISTDNVKGGELGAEQLAKLLNGKGKVILLRYQVGSASTEGREKGFMEQIKKYPDITVISSDQYTGPTRDSAYQAAQNVLNRHGKEVDGMFAVCEPVTVGITMALKDIGKAAGGVKVVGFDSGTQSVEALKRGDIQGLVVQNPMNMGYLGVMKVVDHINKKKVEKRIDTGVKVITRENMDEPENKELLTPPLDKYL